MYRNSYNTVYTAIHGKYNCYSSQFVLSRGIRKIHLFTDITIQELVAIRLLFWRRKVFRISLGQVDVGRSTENR